MSIKHVENSANLNVVNYAAKAKKNNKIKGHQSSDLQESESIQETEKKDVRYSAEDILHFLGELGFNIRYNELLRLPEVTAMNEEANRSLVRKSPTDSVAMIRDEPITNRIDSILQEQLADYKKGKGGTADSKRFFRSLDHAPAYHPYDDYLVKVLIVYKNNPKGEAILNEVIDHITFSDISDREFFRQAIRLFLINHVCRIKQRLNGKILPQNPVLVLQGLAQGKGKSSFVESLCPSSLREKYFNAPEYLNPENKDHKKLVSNSFLMEIPEVGGSLSKADFNRFKSFLTLPNDVFRPPYAMRDEKKVRLCSFIGTSNDPSFLTDTTGNRRWWVCKLIGFDRTWFINEFNADELWGWVVAEAEALDFSTSWPEEFIEEAAKRALQATIEETIDDLVEQLEFCPGKRVTNTQLRGILISNGHNDHRINSAMAKLKAAIKKKWPEVNSFNTEGNRGLTNLSLVKGHAQNQNGDA
jgi:predicted P-loop ATPase